MDNMLNPFSPGAGTPPPDLAGREKILEAAQILLGRTLKQKPEKSLFITGLRGVGKTVLLNTIHEQADTLGYKTSMIEIAEQKNFAEQLIPEIRRILLELNAKAKAIDVVNRSLRVLRSFINSIKITIDNNTFGIDIEPELGSADSGILELDLTALFVSIGKAAKENHVGIALIFDEVQYLHNNELAALVAAMHKMQQLQLPVVIVGAGLPTLYGILGDAKSYSERLFSFPAIGPLSQKESIDAIQNPIIKEGESITAEALQKIYAITQGYPYFIQEWGYQSWNIAQKSPITEQDVLQATHLAEKRLDENFFQVRFHRLTPKEKRYLRTMAGLGAEPQRSSDIALAMDVKSSALGTIRENLIRKGMIYSPKYGYVAFTVPLFDDFMCRIMANLQDVFE